MMNALVARYGGEQTNILFCKCTLPSVGSTDLQHMCASLLLVRLIIITRIPPSGLVPCRASKFIWWANRVPCMVRATLVVALAKRLQQGNPCGCPYHTRGD